MAYSYKGSINFGLVYIPIKLETAVKPSEISFNQLDKKTKSRVRYQKTCDDCNGRVINNDDIVKAYRYEEGKYVTFDDKDFEKIKSKKEKGIVIEQFAELADIDPIYFNKPYYVVPIGGEKAFSLLLNAMKSTKKVAIAKTVLGQKETIIALRESNGEMLLYTLYFQEEIKKNSAPKIEESIISAELDMAVMIIKSMTKKFNAKEYKDEYTEKVKAAIAAKIAGREISVPKETHSNVTDLMEALQLSVKRLTQNSNGIDTDGENNSDNNLKNNQTKNKKTTKKESVAKIQNTQNTAKIHVISDINSISGAAKISSNDKKTAQNKTTDKKGSTTKAKTNKSAPTKATKKKAK